MLWGVFLLAVPIIVKAAKSSIRGCTLIKPEDLHLTVDWLAFHVVQGVDSFILLYNEGNDRVFAYTANQLDMLTQWFKYSHPTIRIEVHPYIAEQSLEINCGAYHVGASQFTVTLPDARHFLVADKRLTEVTRDLIPNSPVCDYNLPHADAPVWGTRISTLGKPKIFASDPASGLVDYYFDPRDSLLYTQTWPFPERLSHYPTSVYEVRHLLSAIKICKAKSACETDSEASNPWQILDSKVYPLLPPIAYDVESLALLQRALETRVTLSERTDENTLDLIEREYTHLWTYMYPSPFTKLLKTFKTNERTSVLWVNRQCPDQKVLNTDSEGTVIKTDGLYVLRLDEGPIGEMNNTLTDRALSVGLQSKRFIAKMLPRHRFMDVQTVRPNVWIPNNIHWQCDAGDIWSDRKAPCPFEFPYVGQNLHHIPPANPLYLYGWCKAVKNQTKDAAEVHLVSRDHRVIDYNSLTVCPGWPEVSCCDYVPNTGVNSIYKNRHTKVGNPWGGFAPCSNCGLNDQTILDELKRIRSQKSP